MILRVRKDRTLCLALMEGLSPQHQGCAFPLPYKCTSLQPNITFIKVRGVSYSGPNSVFIYTLCFSRKKLTMLRSTCLRGWAPLSKKPWSPSRTELQTAALPGEPAAGNLSGLFFCDGGVSIWPRISSSQNSALSDTAISWFLSTVPLFSLSLCLHSELSYFGAEPACFSASIWIYSHRLSL